MSPPTASRWSGCAIPARAGPASGTRPATGEPPGSAPAPWSPDRSRDSPANATGWRCARSCRPPRLAVRTGAAHGDRDVTVATVLPLAWPGLHRADGVVLVGLQTQVGSGDAGRDVAHALLAALSAPAGSPVTDGAGRARDPAAGRGARPRRAVRGAGARGVRLLARRGHRRDPRGASLDGAGQRGGGPDPPADRCRGRVLVRRRVEAPSALGDAPRRRTSCSTPWPDCTRPAISP